MVALERSHAECGPDTRSQPPPANVTEKQAVKLTQGGGIYLCHVYMGSVCLVLFAFLLEPHPTMFRDYSTSELRN